MKITIVQPTVDGLADDDYPPEVYEGHLEPAACERIARGYGGYARCVLSRDEDGSHLATYSNLDKDPEDGDSYGEDDEGYGSLQVRFTHGETKVDAH